jgi:hypothetical protein
MASDDQEQRAISALERFAGCTHTRAQALIQAWKEVFADEALAVVAGTERVVTTVGDLRVERLRRLVAKLSDDGAQNNEAGETGRQALPNAYELGVLLRITQSQARTVLRNWQARYPEEFEDRMRELAAQGKRDVGGGAGANATWIIEYDDPSVFAFAVDLLRRYGLEKGLVPNRSALKVEIPKSTKAGGADALAVLGIKSR